jgi:selenocysteine lyase/cysteine desulfurase
MEDPRMNALAAHLTANQVKFSLRRGLLRFSFHVYNNEADVQRILGLAQEFQNA